MPSQALRYAPTAATGAQHGGRAPAGVANQARVWVLRDGEPVAVPVTAGLDDDTFTEIVQGELKAGDQVIVAEQRDTAKSAVPTPRL